ncbi:MAG TPA: tRNA lysidine(34) synthetase TilS, partial [Casimicrobiaceae bacterium]|nr:tRNA lysidine(34) synthetase TilS [Casimicrobiaceae bacterium]
MRDAEKRVRDGVRAAMQLHASSGARIAVALSGGRDSTVLLDATHAEATSLRHDVVALHVHHGLSPHADAWSAHCEALCRSLDVPIAVERVDVPRAPRKSLEGTAREARYRALAAMAQRSGAAMVMLGHQQDDQAETLLLHLLRGSGPRGLAAIPRVRDARGVRWVRPLLDIPRTVIDAYVEARALRYV